MSKPRAAEDEANAILMGTGGASFSFDEVGDTVTGIVVSLSPQQQSDFKTKKPLSWDDGRPKMQVRVTLQTDLVDGEGIKDPSEEQIEDDDGVRNIYLRWKSADAVKKAVRAAKAARLEVGGKLRLTFSGEEPPAARGGYPTKLYEARYKPPVDAVGDDVLDEAGAGADEPDEVPAPRRKAAKKAPARKTAARRRASDDDNDDSDPGF